MKNAKMGDFAWHNRKTSVYFTRNELQSASNRKTSAYFAFSDFSIKTSTSKRNYFLVMRNDLFGDIRIKQKSPGDGSPGIHKSKKPG
ncbi:hypothetical protein BABA_19371 [Neobacillus bataviensis LMG 21833]|uniref:Uncharacterized protein n=1 Tax=Neobacillus bataviensis LMG 21833 TaxID=1117379 RepID=K6C3B9_9BACI|nr:hypothetical protein BABA_19371 [Neobacillus bataviensis LMG 21833]